MPSDDETRDQLTPQDSRDLGATRRRPADAPLPAAPPSDTLTIPGYDLMPEIARGGMGVVYRAHDRAFGREVAVKVMLPGMNAAEFVREARITGRLPHPGIPPVYALGTLPDGRPFLAMKLIRGDTLDKVLKARTDLSADRGKLLAAFEQISQAVGYAHAQGIIHRDLKPSNIMVGAFGEVQVMDWGLAKELRSAEPEPATPSAPTSAPEDIAATVAGAIKGTPAYMAPEQARGEPVDARADVFALGGILTAILTGKPPFAGDSVMDTIIRAAQADLDDAFDRLNACGADAELIDVAAWCMKTRAAKRPANGTELAVAIAAYRAEVEERLQRAERERAAAEAKAEEEANTRRESEGRAKAEMAKARERRRKRSAQIGLVVVALCSVAAVLGVQREARLEAGRKAELTRVGAEGVLDQLPTYYRRGEWDQALALLNQAKPAAADSDSRIEEMFDRRSREIDFLSRLDRIRREKAFGDEGWNPGSAEMRYLKAFEYGGYNFRSSTEVELAAKLQADPMREFLLTALVGHLPRPWP